MIIALLTATYVCATSLLAATALSQEFDCSCNLVDDITILPINFVVFIVFENDWLAASVLPDSGVTLQLYLTCLMIPKRLF